MALNQEAIFFKTLLLFTVTCSSLSLKFTAEDGRLLCNATGMTLKINYTKFISHDRPFEIHFKNTTDHACSVPHNSSENLINDQLQIHATYNTCGIDIFERGDDIVYNQTVLLTYGINPKSDLVYREEVIKFDVECKKMSNLTVYLEALGHINVTELAEQTFTKSEKTTFDIVFNRKTSNSFNEAESSSALMLGVTMYFELQLKSQRNDLKISPQTCYATNARNNKKYSLIKNRCPNPDDGTVKILNKTSTNKLFHWEAQSFRFFNSSNAVYFACGVVVCQDSNPLEVCNRCFSSSTRRRRRDLESADGQVESAITVTSPLYVLIDAPLQQDVTNPPETSDQDDFTSKDSSILSGTKGTIIVILAVCFVATILIFVIKVTMAWRYSSSPPLDVSTNEQL